MERRLYEAAVNGNVISLHNLLQEDALVLDRFMVSCHVETPLHIASMLGHAEFVQEILTRKPELAGELDSRKASPLHLATAKGFLDIVKRLILVNPEMCFVCDRDGRNPLHIASLKGHVSVLRELVRVRPHATQSLMDRGETILHLCVRYNQLEAMKFLMEVINDRMFVNSKDEDGNTILHLAVIDKQVEAVKFLTTSDKIEVNELNANGITAMDILSQSIRDVKYWEIAEMLQLVGAIRARDIHFPSNNHGTTRTARYRHLTTQENDQIITSQSKSKDSKKDWSEKKRNTLMVIASLMATMAFQAGLTPPGGLWQDTLAANTTSRNSEHKAGFPIMYSYYPSAYEFFIVCNTIGYGASLSIILLQISGLPCFRSRFFTAISTIIMWVAIIAMGLAYRITISTLTDSFTPYTAAGAVLFGWMSLMAILLLGHIIRFIVRMIKCLIRIGRGHSSSDGHGPRHSV